MEIVLVVLLFRNADVRPRREGVSLRFDLGALVSKEHRDRVTVRTRGASQPDANGTVTLTAPVKELVYVFDTGFRHIGVKIHVALEPNE